MSYVVIWLQACLHWRCAYFQTLSWNDTIFVVDWDILYKLCGSANKWSKGFVFSVKICRQFFSCHKACSKYHTRSTITPKYTLTQHLVIIVVVIIIIIMNSTDFTTPPLVSPWGTSAEIPYWWRVTTQISVVLLTGRLASEFASTTKKHFADLGGDTSPVWNFVS